MKAETASLREGAINVLDFLASASRQRFFAAKVFYADYASEFFEWWFDDLGVPPRDELLQGAFNSTECAALERFSKTFEEADKELGEIDRSIDDLLALPAWRSVMKAAAEAHRALAGESTQS